MSLPSAAHPILSEQEAADARFMRQALRLARRGQTSPNPRVGCVVVREGRIIATGFHAAAGQPHAEVEALRTLDFHAEGATLYVNLEPCAHFGRTPPCVDAILRSGVREVVAGMVDPNPLVQGRGFERLERAGVCVRSPILEAECQQLNVGFVKAITRGLPYFTLKVAATADGRTATRTGASRWITSEPARRHVHYLRAQSDAVLVGIGTVLADDPSLTVRLPGFRRRQPLRVVLDSSLRIPLHARLCTDGGPTLVFCGPDAPADRVQALQARGIQVEPVGLEPGGGLELQAVAHRLQTRGMIYVLVEAGARLAGALAASGLVDRYCFYYAPTLFGGESAPGMLGGEGIADLGDAVALHFDHVRRLGPDLLVEARPMNRPGATGEGGS